MLFRNLLAWNRQRPAPAAHILPVSGDEYEAYYQPERAAANPSVLSPLEQMYAYYSAERAAA